MGPGLAFVARYKAGGRAFRMREDGELHPLDRDVKDS